MTPETAALSSEYLAEQVDLRVRRTRIGCLLTLTLVPLGSALDLFGYPQQFWSIFVARMLCDAFLLPIFLLLFTEFGKRHIVWLSTLWAFSPAVTIAWMIFITDGSASPFYAGLNLVIIGTCILLPYGLLESLLYCLGVLACYAVACILHQRTEFIAPLFINNALFIFMTSTICVTACYFYSNARVRDFLLRYELKERNAQLQELDEMKSRFFANVSHELRTPLTLLIAPVRHLLETQPNLASEVSGSLQLVERNALRLLRLINDLLDLVRFDAGKTRGPFQSLDLRQVIKEVIEATMPLAIQQQVQLSWESNPEEMLVSGEASQLEKVFLNLLVNAVKFTLPGGSVTVRCSRQNAQVVAEIIDTGIGVAAADLSRIFERFQQSDNSATRKHQGLGVGLTLSREIVIAHGGQIFATSTPGKGSTFTVRLNASDEAALPAGSDRVEESDHLTKLHRDAARSAAAPTHATPVVGISSEALATVLVVDDEPDIQIFLSNVLAKEFAVRVAADGLTAFKLVKEAPPAVLVIDMMMPGKTGLEVCRDLQTSQLATDTKILMLTARMDEQLKLAAIAAGASDFLNKPFSTAEVLARVRTLAQSSGLQRSLRQRTREVEQAFQDLQAAESRLIQAEKMHALGGLAAGLLHEFNNPINHALMAVECGRALLAKLPQESGPNVSASQKLVVNLTETLDDTQMSLERVGNIISDLRSFAYPESIDLKKPFELRTIVDSAVRFVSLELSEVALTIDVPMTLQAVGAPSHITQVFVNILLNAVAAMQATKALRSPEIRIAARELGERIQITIRDNGTGIPGDVLAHVFDPFFTTKQVGDGIGLGLSICHTIMQQHGQAISIDTQVGEYTTFCFELAKSTEGAVRYEHVH